MASTAHHVGILVFDGMKMLDVSGPAEVFSEANRNGADYRLSFVSVGGGPVRSSIGMMVPADSDTAAAPPFDTFLVSGGDNLPGFTISSELQSAAT